jgi:hypothetical protein
MPRVGFEPTSTVFDRVKKFYALDRAATMIVDLHYATEQNLDIPERNFNKLSEEEWYIENYKCVNSTLRLTLLRSGGNIEVNACYWREKISENMRMEKRPVVGCMLWWKDNMWTYILEKYAWVLLVRMTGAVQPLLYLEGKGYAFQFPVFAAAIVVKALDYCRTMPQGGFNVMTPV